MLVHGPNLNRLGRRNPEIYGTITLEEIERVVTERAAALGFDVRCFQSNDEGDLIDWLQTQAEQAAAIIINPGGLAHFSVSLRDALEDTKKPVVEVHISDPSSRESFRHPLITATAAVRVIAGKALNGYLEAVDVVHESRRGE